MTTPTTSGDSRPTLGADTDNEGPTSAAEAIASPVGFDTIGPGQSIDRYRVLQRLGEGGCGVVYLAEQSEPVRRRVALKVIKIGMDTKAVIARFNLERQALAMMEHPNIAKVLDAGATNTGRPYFVMELVRGVRITEYCDQHHTTTWDRLKLFAQVCHSIQHAHLKGIIHRDIKPSNILVTDEDRVPVPKVIDFGIAKTMHGRLTDATVVTAFEQFMGTPAYMSPEQAELSGLDIDTRSDIYSLGVVLYELLTGGTPLDPKTLATAGLHEIRRKIRDEIPDRPSVRIGTIGPADAAQVAEKRGATLAALSAQIRGDLDWIVMKALEKQRSRRYATAAELIADIDRHMHDEPVLARPPGAAYRFQKFVTRHKSGVVAAATVASVLLSGFLISMWQAARAMHAERVALAEREVARRSQDRADDLLAYMLGDLRTQLEKVGRLDVLEAVGKEATAYFSSLQPDDLTDATLARHAKALRQMGEIRMKQLRYAEANDAFAAAYERAAALAARHPRDTAMLFERGQAEFWIGAGHRNRRAIAEAKEWLTRYRQTGAELVALEPESHEWRRELLYGFKNLAVLKNDHGDFVGARAEFTAMRTALEAMIAAHPDDPHIRFSLTDTESWLGTLAERAGNFAAAIGHFAAEAKGLQTLLMRYPSDMQYRLERADSLSFQVRILMLTGQRAAARPYLDEARRVIDSLTTHDPKNRDWARISNNIRLQEADLALANGNLAEASRLVGAVRQEVETPMEGPSAEQNLSGHLVRVLRMEAQVRSALGDARAFEVFERAIAIGEESVRLRPKSEDAKIQLAQTLVAAAQVAHAHNKDETGLAYARRATELLAPSLEGATYWRLLDPAVRAFALLGQSEQESQLRARLEERGYIPLTPWP